LQLTVAHAVSNFTHPPSAVGLDVPWAVDDNGGMSIVVDPTDTLASRFHALADEWRAATRFLASPSAASEHPAYRALVSLGQAAVPLILAELAAAPEPWFAALRELTGADPVPPDDRGRPKVAAEHWLAWGRASGMA
jgi:hypothetical protein